MNINMMIENEKTKKVFLFILAAVFCSVFIDNIKVSDYYLFEVLLGLSCIVTLIYIVFAKKVFITKHYILIPFFLIIIWSIIEMFLFNGQKYAPKYFIYALIEIFLFINITINFVDKENYKNFIKYTCWIFSLLAFVLIGYYFSQGVFVNYNDFGQSYSKFLIGFAALSCYYLTLSERKITYGILTFVFLIFSMLSTIRKMWLALFIAFVIISILYLLGPAKKILKKKEYRKSLLLIGSLGIAVVIAAALLFVIYPKFTSTVDQSVTSNVSNGDILRGILNRDAIQRIKQSPIIGNGWGDRVYIEELGKHSLYHNSFLAVFAQLGLIGFVLYYGVFAYTLVKSVLIMFRKPEYFLDSLFILALWLFAAVTLYYRPLNRMSYYLWGVPFIFTLIFEKWEKNKNILLKFQK